MIRSFPFKKTERLRSANDIDLLFKEGKAFNCANIRIIHLLSEDSKNSGIKLLISVPKRKVKRAVDRNYIKRIIREAYRLNKQTTADLIFSSKCLHVSFIFIGNVKDVSYNNINETVKNILEKLNKIYRPLLD